SLCLPLKSAVYKSLFRFPRRDVGLVANFFQPKLRAQLGDNGLLIVTHDFQAAALRRAVERERGDDQGPARLQCATQCRDVFATVIGSCQKVENGSIVPQAETMRRDERSHIRLEPLDCAGSGAETRTAMAQGDA